MTLFDQIMLGYGIGGVAFVIIIWDKLVKLIKSIKTGTLHPDVVKFVKDPDAMNNKLKDAKHDDELFMMVRGEGASNIIFSLVLTVITFLVFLVWPLVVLSEAWLFVVKRFKRK